MKILFILQQKTLCLFLLACIFLSSCNSFTYHSRLVFWNIPSPKDHKKFPRDIINKSNETYHFAKGTEFQEKKINEHLKVVFDVNDVNKYLKKQKTSAFLVITNDTIVFERYYKGHDRESIQTSFSIAKSIVSLLVDKALEDGKIESLDTPITNYLPELLKIDSRFQEITILQLLDMDSPICHNEKKDGLKALYYPDLKQLVFNTLQLFDCPENSEIEDYNNYNTILLGIMIERVTGTRIAAYFGKHIWSEIGTESNVSWSTDKNGQTMMSAGINARAVDFAKLGKLVLDDGKWKNKVLIRKEWLQESIHRNSYHWYKSYLGYNRDLRKSDFYALGIRGQILYVSPNLNTIIVRFGSSRLGLKKPKNVDSRWKNINWEFAGMNWADRIKKLAKELHASSK